MCTRPLRLQNKGYKPIFYYSNRFNIVPCGHCKECLQGRVNEVLFRADVEFADVKDSGGFAVFATLTYAPQHLPILTYRNSHGNLKTISTWNQRHITLLFKSLRNLGWSIRYIMTCERGHDDLYKDSYGNIRRGTSRPHYHLIFFVYPDSDVDNFSKESFFYDLDNLWYQGITYNEEVDRTSEKAMEYVTKYAFKNQYEPIFKIPVSSFVSHNQVVCDKYLFPRSRQSHFIGASYESYILSQTNVAEFLANHKVMTSTGAELSIPRYYWKRLCYFDFQLCDFIDLYHKKYRDVFDTFVDESTGELVQSFYTSTEDLRVVRKSSYMSKLGVEVFYLRIREKFENTYVSALGYLCNDCADSVFDIDSCAFKSELDSSLLGLLKIVRIKRFDLYSWLRETSKDVLFQYFIKSQNESFKDISSVDSGVLNWYYITIFLQFLHNKEKAARTFEAEQLYQQNFAVAMFDHPLLFQER